VPQLTIPFVDQDHRIVVANVIAKLKRGGEQTVRVEHVHVYSGGQAVVGAVSTQRAEGGVADEKENQAYGTLDPRAITAAPGAAFRPSCP
jgi:hypothetical protein